MLKLLRWLFWRAYYLPLPRPTTFDAWLTMMHRTCWPWPRRFRPFVWHNDSGGYWQVYWSGERDYTERRTLTLDVHIGMESGRIVGVNLWDEVLESKKEGLKP